jgi:DNA-directed RNA polymerase subunit E'/Rpb7
MIITRQLRFDPKFIDENIIHKLVELVKTTFEGTSSKDDGIIRRVNYLKRIVTNEISKTTGNIIFTLEIDVDLVHPKVGDTFPMTITKIDPKALFVEGDVFKAIVSADNIIKFEFSKSSNTFYNHETHKHIKLKDSVDVTIIAMRYDNNMFKYVGRIE